MYFKALLTAAANKLWSLFWRNFPVQVMNFCTVVSFCSRQVCKSAICNRRVSLQKKKVRCCFNRRQSREPSGWRVVGLPLPRSVWPLAVLALLQLLLVVYSLHFVKSCGCARCRLSFCTKTATRARRPTTAAASADRQKGQPLKTPLQAWLKILYSTFQVRPVVYLVFLTQLSWKGIKIGAKEA